MIFASALGVSTTLVASLTASLATSAAFSTATSATSFAAVAALAATFLAASNISSFFAIFVCYLSRETLSAHLTDVHAKEVQHNDHEQTNGDGCEYAADHFDAFEPDQVAPAQRLQG